MYRVQKKCTEWRDATITCRIVQKKVLNRVRDVEKQMETIFVSMDPKISTFWSLEQPIDWRFNPRFIDKHDGTSNPRFIDKQNSHLGSIKRIPLRLLQDEQEYGQDYEMDRTKEATIGSSA
eukprot:Gb_14476 [translate_table: standard]